MRLPAPAADFGVLCRAAHGVARHSRSEEGSAASGVNRTNDAKESEELARLRDLTLRTIGRNCVNFASVNRLGFLASSFVVPSPSYN